MIINNLIDTVCVCSFTIRDIMLFHTVVCNKIQIKH